MLYLEYTSTEPDKRDLNVTQMFSLNLNKLTLSQEKRDLEMVVK